MTHKRDCDTFLTIQNLQRPTTHSLCKKERVKRATKTAAPMVFTKKAWHLSSGPDTKDKFSSYSVMPGILLGGAFAAKDRWTLLVSGGQDPGLQPLHRCRIPEVRMHSVLFPASDAYCYGCSHGCDIRSVRVNLLTGLFPLPVDLGCQPPKAIEQISRMQ